MRVNYVIVALSTLFALSLNLNQATGRVLSSGALVTDGKYSLSNNVDTRGLIGGGKGGKGGKDGKDDPPTEGGTSSGGVGGLGGKGGKGSEGGSVTGGLGSDAASAANRDIRGWGMNLEEKTDPKAPAYNNDAFKGFKPTEGKQWRSWAIRAAPEKRSAYGSYDIYEYKTLVLPDGGGAFHTGLISVEKRNLPAKRRDLTMAAWKAAGGDLSKLRVLGDSTVINEKTWDSMQDAIHARFGSKRPEYPMSVNFKPGDKGWNEINNNPFMGGYRKMLSENAADFGHAEIANIRITQESEYVYHLLTGLKRDNREAETPEQSFSEGVN
ncbi:hypothetical protein F4805DRAFT_478254 [Annulohypoxylon moriforme]|nr:hypothetical protein F4805DRAFT_478254 [Annulohypoxylon moriforme]